MKIPLLIFCVALAVVLFACASPAAAGDLPAMGDITISTDTTLTSNLCMIHPYTLTIESGVTLTINPSVTITNQDGTIINWGTIDNGGTITNGGTFINCDTIINFGTINNYYATINNYDIINNFGIINNYFEIITWSGFIFNYGPCGSINDYCGSDNPWGVSAYTEGIINVLNDAPELDLIGNQEVNEGSLLTITLSASDDEVSANTQTLTYSTTAPFGNLSDNVFTWTPGSGSAGSYDVEFSVSDGCEVDSETITITVKEVTDPEDIPEFSTIALPVTAILGLLFLFNYRKRRKEE